MASQNRAASQGGKPHSITVAVGRVGGVFGGLRWRPEVCNGPRWTSSGLMQVEGDHAVRLNFGEERVLLVALPEEVFVHLLASVVGSPFFLYRLLVFLEDRKYLWKLREGYRWTGRRRKGGTNCTLRKNGKL